MLEICLEVNLRFKVQQKIQNVNTPGVLQVNINLWIYGANDGETMLKKILQMLWMEEWTTFPLCNSVRITQSDYRLIL